MRLVLVPLTTALTLASVLSGCGTTPASGAESSGELKIGVNIERTGRGAGLGAGWYNALQIVEEELNDRGGVDGKKVKLVVKDNKSDPTEAGKIAKEFVKDKSVVAQVGPGLSVSAIKGVVPEVEKGHLPTVAMASATEVTLPVDKRKYVFKTSPSTLQDSRIVVQRLAKLNKRNVALLTSDDAYGTAGARDFQTEAHKAGLKVNVKQFKIADTNPNALATTVKTLTDAQPDALMAFCIWPVAGEVASLAAKQNYANKTYFSSGFSTGEGGNLFARGENREAEGVTMAHPEILAIDKTIATTPGDLRRKAFFATYAERHGSFSGFAPYAADALTLVAEAIKKAGTTDREKVRESLEGVQYDGLTGQFTMTPEDHHGLSDSTLTLLTIRGGRWVPAD
jgi:branched-chain amino acid transport system substrate-binding protein